MEPGHIGTENHQASGILIYTHELEEYSVTCDWCGAVDAKGTCPWAIACPSCGVAPGARCKRPSGHDCDMHSARYLKAEGLGEPARQPGIFDRAITGGDDEADARECAATGE